MFYLTIFSFGSIRWRVCVCTDSWLARRLVHVARMWYHQLLARSPSSVSFQGEPCGPHCGSSVARLNSQGEYRLLSLRSDARTIGTHDVAGPGGGSIFMQPPACFSSVRPRVARHASPPRVHPARGLRTLRMTIQLCVHRVSWCTFVPFLCVALRQY